MKVKPIRSDIRLDAVEQNLPVLEDDSEAQSPDRNMEAESEIDDIDSGDDGDDSPPVRTLQLDVEDDDPEYVHAIALTSPHIGASLAIADLNRNSSLGSPNDLTTLSTVLKAQSNSSGDGINTLKSQSKTLDTIFNRLISKAMGSDQLDVQEAYLKLALKAQNQSRTTFQTISDIRQPKIANVVKQANIAGGHQQVNNGDASPV